MKVFPDDVSPIFGVELQLFEAASNPLDSFNISAPKAPKADKVHGFGSVSWIHKSCVSKVVSSVSVEAAECACWGVVILLPVLPPDLLAPRSFFHVYRRSENVNFKLTLEMNNYSQIHIHTISVVQWIRDRFCSNIAFISISRKFNSYLFIEIFITENLRIFRNDLMLCILKWQYL